MNKYLYLISITAFVATGCATFKPSTIIGASIGATVGGLTGTIIGSPYHPVNGAFLGASSGAALGGLAGYLIGQKSENKTDPKSMRITNDRAGAPAITRPEYNCTEVPDKIEDGGRRYTKRTVTCVIERGSVWTME